MSSTPGLGRPGRDRHRGAEGAQVVVDVGSNGFETLMAYEVENGVFALLAILGHQVVVQTVALLRNQAPALATPNAPLPAQAPAPTGTASEPLDRYFRLQVSQDIRRRVTACFVALTPEQRIAGYYTLASASLVLADLPTATAKRLPRYPSVPAVRMGRLAVDLGFRCQDLGSALIFPFPIFRMVCPRFSDFRPRFSTACPSARPRRGSDGHARATLPPVRTVTRRLCPADGVRATASVRIQDCTSQPPRDGAKPAPVLWSGSIQTAGDCHGCDRP